MKILVTGGAGFIASHIVDAYIAEGHDVVVVDDLSSGKRENLNPGARFYRADICGAEVLEIFNSERPDILNHHAAQIDVRRSVAEPSHDCKVNVLGFLNLMEASRKNGVKKVVLASSGGAMYGEQNVFPAKEDHPASPISPYGITKLTCEKYLYYYSVQYKIDHVALRYANVYGPRQNAHGEAGVVAIFARMMLTGAGPVINGDGLQTRDYVYVKDVVEANKIALSDGANGIYNVGTGVETSVCEVYQALKNALVYDGDVRHAPAKPGEQLRSVISSENMEKTFHWKPKVAFSDGIMMTADWFKDHIDRKEN